MGIDGAPRIVLPRMIAGEPDAERIDHTSGPWILERRDGETLHRIGMFGSFAEALEALDEQVGLGHGSLTDYEFVDARPPSVWARMRARFTRKTPS